MKRAWNVVGNIHNSKVTILNISVSSYVVLLGLLSLILFLGYNLSSKNQDAFTVVNEKVSKPVFNESDKDYLNILFLPLQEVDECRRYSTIYENRLFKRFVSIGDRFGVKVQASLIPCSEENYKRKIISDKVYDKYPVSERSVLMKFDLGMYNNGDILFYGLFEPENKDTTNIYLSWIIPKYAEFVHLVNNSHRLSSPISENINNRNLKTELEAYNYELFDKTADIYSKHDYESIISFSKAQELADIDIVSKIDFIIYRQLFLHLIDKKKFFEAGALWTKLENLVVENDVKEDLGLYVNFIGLDFAVIQRNLIEKEKYQLANDLTELTGALYKSTWPITDNIIDRYLMSALFLENEKEFEDVMNVSRNMSDLRHLRNIMFLHVYNANFNANCKYLSRHSSDFWNLYNNDLKSAYLDNDEAISNIMREYKDGIITDDFLDTINILIKDYNAFDMAYTFEKEQLRRFLSNFIRNK